VTTEISDKLIPKLLDFILIYHFTFHGIRYRYIYYIENILLLANTGVHKFSKNLIRVTSKYLCQHGDMKQVPHRGPTNIRRHRIKYSRHGDLATGICATLSYCNIMRL
jgi:hypothetical protein